MKYIVDRSNEAVVPRGGSTMTKVTKILALAMVALVLAGCEEEFHPAWEEPLTVDGPVMLEDAVVYLDRGFEEIVVIRSDVRGGVAELDAERHATGARPVEMEQSADGSSLYVINRDGESLSIFSIDDDDVERSDVELNSVYDEITVDPEGDFILLSHSGAAEDAILQNRNELGIVDLRDGVPDEVRVLTLPVQPDSLEMVPPFELGGESQRMIVALAPSEVALVDLNADAELDQVRSWPLTVSQADALRNPVQVVFDLPAGDDPDMASFFVLDDRSSDVTQLVIQPPIDEDATRKLRLSINQLAAGDSPRHIAVLELDDVGKRLLALDGDSPKFTLVDVSSGESATFDLRMSVPAEKMVTYTVYLPDEERSEKRVLAYSTKSSLVSIIRPESISVGSETPTLGRAVEEISLSAPPMQVLLGEEAEPSRAVILHPGGNDGFTALNLQTNRDTSFSGFNPTQVAFDSQTVYGIFANTPHLVRFNLISGQYAVHELPLAGRDIYLSPDKESLIVRHRGKSGVFTTLPQGSLEAEDARFYEHIFFDGLLDRPAYVE